MQIRRAQRVFRCDLVAGPFMDGGRGGDRGGGEGGGEGEGEGEGEGGG